MRCRYLALAVLFDLLLPLGALTHQAGCHWLHSCPSDRGNYVCGDLGYCGACPDNPLCRAGHPRQAVTLEVLHEGTPVRVRLYGIDAPEKHQTFGKRAKRYLRALALQHTVIAVLCL